MRTLTFSHCEMKNHVSVLRGGIILPDLCFNMMLIVAVHPQCEIRQGWEKGDWLGEYTFCLLLSVHLASP